MNLKTTNHLITDILKFKTISNNIDTNPPLH